MTTLYIAAVVFFIGVRHDFATVIAIPIFQFELGLMLAVAISAAMASFWMRVPDMRGHQWMVAVPLSILFAYALWEGTNLLDTGMALPHRAWHHCAGESLLMIALPVLAMVFMGRKGSTTRPRLMGLMNAIAVSSAGYIGLRITCGAESMTHIGPFHILPYLVLGVVLGLAARRLYRW